MADEVPVASRVIRRVLTRAIGDADYRRTLLASPTALMRYELARAGGPVPGIEFEAVEETEDTWVLRVPFSPSEREAQSVLQPLFEFVDAAEDDELDRFVRKPRRKLEKLLGVELDPGTKVAVMVESEDHRILVIPRDEFGAVGAGESELPAGEARIKLCPKGHTLCPQDVTVADPCPADCTFTARCDCTISSTDTGDFCTIQGGPTLDALREESVRKLSDRLDD